MTNQPKRYDLKEMLEFISAKLQDNTTKRIMRGADFFTIITKGNQRFTFVCKEIED